MSDAHDDEHPPAGAGGRSGMVVVFAGGDPMPWDARALVPMGAHVIAADAGLHHAQAIDVHVDEVIGDFDSVRPDALAAAEADGARIERHPAAKDQTDLELSLRRAVERAPAEVVVIGGHGGRLDHLLGNAMVLAAPELAAVRVRAYLGTAQLHVVRDVVELRGRVGDVLTLLPVHGPAHDVVTTGLEFPLRGETLHPGSTRGVSNTFLRSEASVRVGDGALLAVAPDAPPPTP
jgi:thiamine pyrophosphokinase